MDRIVVLTTLMQTRHEYQQPLWIAYVDLRAAFDSVDRETLWLLLRSLGLPPKIVDPMKELYTDTISCVRVDGAESDWFPIKSGVRQGCTIAPNLFLAPMDWLLQRTIHKGFLGATLRDQSFTDLDYADEVALLAEMLEVLLLSMEIMQSEAQVFGLEINWAKTKIQALDNTPASIPLVQVSGTDVKVVDSFTYLGCNLHNSGSSEVEAIRRI
jgi:hypothetical protein